MGTLILTIQSLLKSKETSKADQEMLCALRLSYNNFHEKVSEDEKNYFQDTYAQCMKK